MFFFRYLQFHIQTPMKNFKLRIVGFLAIVIMFSLPVCGQTKNELWLNFGGGLNFIHSFDQGASPLNYWGIGLNSNPSVIWKRNKLHYQFDSRTMANLCLNDFKQQAFEFDLDYRFELLYHLHDSYDNRLHFWVGGATQSFFNIKYYPQLMNAALGMTDFINLCASGMVQYDFAPINNGEHHLFTAYAKLSLPLLSFVNRPTFSYIGNATADPGDFSYLLKDREHLTMVFTGGSSDIGLFYNLPNKNKIGISYRWDYLTTRHRGSYRFDHAIHTFNFNFMFNIL